MRYRQGVTNIEYAMIGGLMGIILLVSIEAFGGGLEKLTTLIAVDISPVTGVSSTQ